MVHSVVALSDAHILAMRKAIGTEPGLVIEADRLHDESVVSLPVAYGVSEPGRVGIGGERPAVGPDGAPFVFALPKLEQASRGRNEFLWGGHEHDTRETDRIALQNGVVSAGCASWAVAGLFCFELRLRPRRHRWHVLIGHHRFGAAAALVLP